MVRAIKEKSSGILKKVQWSSYQLHSIFMLRYGLRVEVCKCGEYLRVYNEKNSLVYDTVFGAARNEESIIQVQCSSMYVPYANYGGNTITTGVYYQPTSYGVPTHQQKHTYWVTPPEYQKCPMCDSAFDAFSMHYCKLEKNIALGMYPKCDVCKYKFFCATQGYKHE